MGGVAIRVMGFGAICLGNIKNRKKRREGNLRFFFKTRKEADIHAPVRPVAAKGRKVASTKEVQSQRLEKAPAFKRLQGAIQARQGKTATTKRCGGVPL